MAGRNTPDSQRGCSLSRCGQPVQRIPSMPPAKHGPARLPPSTPCAYPRGCPGEIHTIRARVESGSCGWSRWCSAAAWVSGWRGDAETAAHPGRQDAGRAVRGRLRPGAGHRRDPGGDGPRVHRAGQGDAHRRRVPEGDGRHRGRRDPAGLDPGGPGRHRRPRAAAPRPSTAPGDCGVLLHDAARPLVDQRIIADCVAALQTHDAAGVAVPASDTMVVTDNGVMQSMPRRETLLRCQTPQCFRLPVITRAHELAAADPDPGVSPPPTTAASCSATCRTSTCTSCRAASTTSRSPTRRTWPSPRLCWPGGRPPGTPRALRAPLRSSP